jgi:exonuclease SbcC
MRPVRISLEGFLSYRDRVEVDLSDVGAAAILGPNGAGKTTLVEAIGWALWGEGRGRSPDDYVNPESTSARVSVVFDLAGKRYVVTRERLAGKSARSSLSLAVWDILGRHERDLEGGGIDVEEEFGFRDIGHPNIADTERAIVDLVGMTFETWESTSFVGQGRADAFTRLRPAERKRLLAEVLELERFGRLADLARTAVGEAKGHLQGLQLDLNRVRLIVGHRASLEAELERATERRAALEADLLARQTDAEEAAAALQEAQDAVSAVSEAGSRAAVLTGRLRGLRAEMDALRLEQHRLEEAAAAGPEAAEAYAKAIADIAEADQRREALEKSISDARRALSTVEERFRSESRRQAEAELRRQAVEELGGVCPTCRQPIDDGLSARLLAEAHAEVERLDAEVRLAAGAGAAYRAQIARAEADLADVKSSLTEAQDRASGWRRSIEDAQRAEGEMRRLVSRFESLEPTMAEMEAENAKLQELPDAAVANERLRNAQSAREIARARAGEALDAVTKTVAVIGSLEAQMRAVTEAERDLERYESERTEVEAMLGVAELAASAFGRDGIPALILETAIPELEAAANELLETLTGGRFTVALETLAAKKTGGVRESLEIVVGDDVSERPLESLSGGERAMVDLSLRIALSRLLVGRRGRQIECLILDEPFVALDDGHRQRTIAAFAKLVDVFPTMLTVTHLPDLAEAFPTRFVVERAGGTSTVRREG